MGNETQLITHLFRQEFSKMVAVISKLYGLQHIEIAEDIVSETFLQATEFWKTTEIPANPTAWLYTVAKQRTLSHFRRNNILVTKVIPQWQSSKEDTVDVEDLDFSLQNIKDSQLNMLFAVCNPVIASEAQIGLALRVLCGFGIEEIADAFFTNKETINKRLFRAKEKMRLANIRMELPSENELHIRLDNVLHIIYLLFSEGYYSKTQNQVFRKELCLEAMRLGMMLIGYQAMNVPKTNALMALMCFHSSRFDARQTSRESIVLYDDQDESEWNKDLINQGIHFLLCAAEGDEISSYHLEAKIAYCYSTKKDSPDKWKEILQLYNQLLLVNYSPAVALSRTYALYKAEGKEKALQEAEKLRLTSNHFYFVLLGELYQQINPEKAKENFQKALNVAKTALDKQVILNKMKFI